MSFNYTFRSDDISGWDADTRDLVENRDRELELYSSTIDDSFLNLNADNLTSGTIPSLRVTGSYSGITEVGTLSGGIASYSIGDTGPAGGKVFITPSTSGNTTGLYFEVALVTAEVQRTWAQFSPINYQSTSVPLAQFDTIGSGKSNTVAIVNQGNSNSSTCAAKYCDDFTYNGFSDWFLASKAELAEMYTNRVVLGNDFAPFAHWTSSQYSLNRGWFHNFGSNAQNISSKGSLFYLRPVRSFSALGLNVIGSTVVRTAATQDGVIITGRAGGTSNYAVTILPTTLTANQTVTLPDVSGTAITTGDIGSVTNTMLAGSITNAKLANSTISGISLGSNLATLTIGTGLSGTSYNGSTATTIALANTAVTAASYTNASITVDAQGRLTAASSGTSPVTTVTGTSPVVSSGGATPAISLAANYGDTLNPYAAKTAAFVLAGPATGTATAPTFRAIVATDIPTLNQNTTGTAATVTGAAQTAITSVGTLTALRVNGNFGIGTNGLPQMGLWLGKNIEGSAFSQSIYMSGAIQATVTSRADMIWTAPTVAASVTLPTLQQFYATLAGVGAGSTITASTGFYAESNIGNNYSGTITNAYGFFGNLASGTGRYNLYMQGTANNFLNGRLGVGAVLTTGAMAIVANTTAADKAFIVKGASSQLGDFLDVQNSGGTSQFRVDSAGNLFVASNAITGDAKTKLGLGRSGNGYSYIDLIGDATYTDYGFRVIRNSNGANANSELQHRGTGNFALITLEAAPIVFNTSNTERMRITSAGLVGIGITAPTSKLHVVGSFSRGAPVTKTASFTLADSENWVICNGAASITVTLPGASTQVGREISLKNIAAFTVVSATANVVPLTGGAAGTAILATAGTWATLVSDGTNWIIMQS